MCRQSILLVLTLLYLQNLNAEESYQLKNEDHRLINMTSLDFHVCIQQDAQKQLAGQADVRNISATAVLNCDDKLEPMRQQLGSQMNPMAYTGLERSIKNRAIKKLLMQLMYQRSAESDETENQ